MKKLLWVIAISIIISLVGGIGYIFGNKTQKKSIVNIFSGYSSGEVLVGTSDNLKSMPIDIVLADATTTDSGGYVDDGGVTVDQLVVTTNIDKVFLLSKAVGKVSTSTLYIRH